MAGIFQCDQRARRCKPRLARHSKRPTREIVACLQPVNEGWVAGGCLRPAQWQLRLGVPSTSHVNSAWQPMLPIAQDWGMLVGQTERRYQMPCARKVPARDLVPENGLSWTERLSRSRVPELSTPMEVQPPRDRSPWTPCRFRPRRYIDARASPRPREPATEIEKARHTSLLSKTVPAGSLRPDRNETNLHDHSPRHDYRAGGFKMFKAWHVSFGYMVHGATRGHRSAEARKA